MPMLHNQFIEAIERKLVARDTVNVTVEGEEFCLGVPTSIEVTSEYGRGGRKLCIVQFSTGTELNLEMP